MTLTAEPLPVAYGSEVTLTAKVSQEAATPGERTVRPSGTVDFGIVTGRLTTQFGDPAPLTPDPVDPGAALATLKVKAFGDDWAIGANDIKASYSGQNAAPSTPGLAQADGRLSLQVGKAPIHPSVSIEGWTYGQAAKSPVLDPGSNPGGGEVSYAYKPQGAPDSGYTDAAPAKAGSYTLRATVSETDRYASGEAMANFAIAKADQAAPSLTAKPEAVSGKGDGAIEGLTAAMEWATSEAGPYQLVTDPRMAFKPGTYQVRLAADANHDASSAAKVTVVQGPKLKVSLPSDRAGYTLTADKTTLDWHESANLTFKLAPGYTEGPGFAVKANGQPVSPGQDGTYVLSNLEASVTVTVEGVADQTAPAVSVALGNDAWGSFSAEPGTAPAEAGAQNLAVKATDAGSGLAQVEYLLSDAPFASVDSIHGTWIPVSTEAGSGKIRLESPGASYVYVRATDMAGNSEVVSAPRIVRYDQPSLSPSAVNFEPASPADVAVQMTLSGNTLAGVSAGGHGLKAGTDYTVSGSTLTLKASYLTEQAKAAASLALSFSFDPAGVSGASPKPTATLTVSLGKVPIHPSVSIEGWTYGQSANSPVLEPGSNPGGGKVVYEYKPQGTPDSSYSEAVPTKAGAYTLRATVGEAGRYATADFSIAKANQAAPAKLTAKAENVSGKGDGTIGGLTAAMEWAASDAGPYAKVADPNMAFKPGTYQVRLAADADHNASPAAGITIGAGPKLKVSLPADSIGYTLTADKTALDWHESATLAFELSEGYTKTASFAVKATGAAISSGPDGAYIVSDAEADVAVSVEGVAPEFTQQTVYDGSHDVSLEGMLMSGAKFVVTPLPSGDASCDALSKMALAAGQDVVDAYEAKLIGNYEGRLRISFKVDDAYEGKTLTVYHQKDAGGIEELHSVVKDGWASVEVDGLSPFLVAADRVPAPQPGAPGSESTPGVPVPQPDVPGAQLGASAGSQGAATLAPQTGDGLPLDPLALAALASGAALGALGARRRRCGGR